MLVAYLIASYFVINNNNWEVNNIGDFENHLKKLREKHKLYSG